MKIVFNSINDFEKEFNRLKKKYKLLDYDLDNFKLILPNIVFEENKNFAVLSAVHNYKIIKARFTCRYLKGKPALRIIFSFSEKDGKCDFLEMYFKGNNETENKERIKEYVANLEILCGDIGCP